MAAIAAARASTVSTFGAAGSGASAIGRKRALGGGVAAAGSRTPPVTRIAKRGSGCFVRTIVSAGNGAGRRARATG